MSSAIRLRRRQTSRPPASPAMKGRHEMAAHHRKRNRQSSKARRRRAVGLSSTAGAALAFGLTPWATAPPAHADELDAILDPIINSLSAIDPTLAVDATS